MTRKMLFACTALLALLCTLLALQPNAEANPPTVQPAPVALNAEPAPLCGSILAQAGQPCAVRSDADKHVPDTASGIVWRCPVNLSAARIAGHVPYNEAVAGAVHWTGWCLPTDLFYLAPQVDAVACGYLNPTTFVCLVNGVYQEIFCPAGKVPNILAGTLDDVCIAAVLAVPTLTPTATPTATSVPFPAFTG